MQKETIKLNKLTYIDREALKNLALPLNKNSLDNLIASLRDLPPNSHKFKAGLFLLCPNCRVELWEVRKRNLAQLFKSETLGYYCANPSCKFHYKLIPKQEAHELIYMARTSAIARA